MLAATRRGAWASCALRACVRFVVTRVLVVVSTLGVRSRRATARGYAFREAVGTYKEALEQLRLRLHRRRRAAGCCCCFCGSNDLGPPSRRRARTHRLGETCLDAPLMLRHWDDTFSNVFSGRPGTSVPIFVSMDHANYAGRLMNPLSMAMDVHVCQACRRDRRPGLHIARVGSRLAQHQEQARAGLPRRGPHQLAFMTFRALPVFLALQLPT